MQLYRLFLVTLLALFGFAIAEARAQSVRGVTDTEILVGGYTDLSGVGVSWGVGNSSAWRMAFDEINAKGGVHGRKIRYIVEDNQYQVPRSIQAANKLINRDGVFLMVANGGTPMNNATLPEQLEKGVPNMFPLTSARSMYDPYHRLKFGLASSYYDQMRSAIKFFAEKKGRKAICAMYQDTDFGRDVMNGVWDQMKAMGTKTVGETTHKPTDTDFSAAVARLRDAKCDLVILGTITRDTNMIVAVMRKTGWNVEVLGNIAIYDSSVAEVPGGTNEGIFAMTSVLFFSPDDPRPAVQEFVKKYRGLYNREPNFAAQLGYSAAYLLVDGLTRAGRNLTVDTFINGMEQVKDHRDIFGSPPMSYGPNRRQGSNESFLVQVRSGKWVPVMPESLGY
jgi:branched-chain amino acid transport system substrate-binding protein